MSRTAIVESPSGASLMLEMRPMRPFAFYLAVAAFAAGYLGLAAGRPADAQLMYGGIGGAFCLFFWVMSHWSDRAVIDRERGLVTARRGIGPLASEQTLPVARARLVTVAMLSGSSTHFVYQVGLAAEGDGGTADDPVGFRLVAAFDIDDAWAKAVAVARYLDLPLRDGMLGGRVWPRGEVPATRRERNARAGLGTLLASRCTLAAWERGAA